MKASVCAIEFVLPSASVDNAQLAAEFVGWTAEKIESKTGILKRHVAATNECASDLATLAAQRLFSSGACTPSEVDFLLYCTQSPDYLLPTTACLLQQRLGLSTQCGALDFNLGCSGYVYGLSLAKGLIETGQARCVLLLTADTYSRYIHPEDRSVRTLFGDAAAATLIVATESSDELMGSFVFGTDGSGGENLIVPTGGCRKPRAVNPPVIEDANGNRRTINHLFMNGTEIFNFTLKRVPETVTAVLAKAGLSGTDVDRYVFHQANRYMLDFLMRKLKLPVDKFEISMAECGNTVSSSIPIALRVAAESGRLNRGQRVLLVGFGVGYSWGGALIRWQPKPMQSPSP